MSAKAIMNLVILGDKDCEKSSILLSFLLKQLDKGHVATFSDKENSTVNVDVNEQLVELQIRCTVGELPRDRINQQYFLGADVILLCYSIDIPHTLLNIETKWGPKLKSLCPKVRVVLLGIRADLPGVEQEEQVTFRDGDRLARRIGADAFCECSVTGEGIMDAFKAVLMK